MTETASRTALAVPTFTRMTNAFLRDAVARWASGLGGRSCERRGFPPVLRLPFLDVELCVSPFAVTDGSGTISMLMEAASRLARESACHRAIVVPASPGRLDALLGVAESRRRATRLWWLLVDQFGGVVAVPPPGFAVRRSPTGGATDKSRGRPGQLRGGSADDDGLRR